MSTFIPPGPPSRSSTRSYDLQGLANFTDATAHPKPDYAMGYRYASGVWAPAIRAHGGRLYIYFPTPTEGIFMASAPSSC